MRCAIGKIVLPSVVMLGLSVPLFADCHWEIRGLVQDQTGQPIPGKVVHLWSQLGSGEASAPEVSGPRETNWAATTTDKDGSFRVRTSAPFPTATCTHGRVIGGAIGTNDIDLGEYGPFPGPETQGGVHIVDIGRIGPARSADEVK